MSYETIKAKNCHLEFLNDNHSALPRYGKHLTIAGIDALIEQADRQIVINSDQNTYVASDPVLDTPENRKLFMSYFGGIEIQIGWVAGPNSTMNGMEYHKSNEIIVAVTDQVLLLGLQSDIDARYQFESKKAKALYLNRGSCFELMPGTLHLSPCKTDDRGFKSLIILPKGTNLPLESFTYEQSGSDTVTEERLLFMKNKWLIAHPERKPLIEKGAHPGIVGENIRVWY
ncbi:MAG TPA: DUF4867 family protein [Spirochaetia bacterium]|nr:DUF4867 family protein [Spirochaetia bacterium]